MPVNAQRLADKTALITGGGRGIGAAIARRISAGGARVAINYHSSAGPARGLESITPDDYQRVFGINVAGQLFATQAAAAVMEPGGALVLTSSVSAQMTVFQHTLYAGSKAAVSAMVRNLAPELAQRGLRINAIAPGGTQTDMAAENAERYTPPARASARTDGR